MTRAWGSMPSSRSGEADGGAVSAAGPAVGVRTGACSSEAGEVPPGRGTGALSTAAGFRDPVGRRGLRPFATRYVVEVRPGAHLTVRPAFAPPLQVSGGLQLPQRAGDEDLALVEVGAERGDADDRTVGQREDVGRDADRDRASAALHKGVGDHGEVGGEAGADVDHAGGRCSGVGAQARVRLRLSHREGAFFLVGQALDRDASPGRGPLSV